MFSLGWTTAKLGHIRSDGGFAYIAPTHHPELSEELDPSLGVVLENGVPLSRLAGAKHADIRKIGKGRTSFWGRYIHFSTSDNSSPATNGRTYEIRYPRYVTDPFAFALYAGTILLLGWAIRLAIRAPELREPIGRALATTPGPVFSALLGLSAFFLALSYAASSNRQGTPSLGWRTDALTSISHETGFAFRASTRHPELSAEERPSPGVVLENGRPLTAGDASHEEIRNQGSGSYSFWGRLVYFSASDNSAPDTNGRSYAIRYPRTVPAAVALVIYADTLVLLGSSAWYASKAPSLRQAIGRLAAFLLNSRLHGIPAFPAFLFFLSCAVYANREGLLPLGWKTDLLADIHNESGFAFKAHTFHPEISEAEFPPATVLENGVPLHGEPGASHEDIRKLGAGRFSFWSDLVYFSASDNSAPDRNGKTYAIRYPVTVGSTVAFAVYAGALLVLGAFVWRRGKFPDPPFCLPAAFVVFIFLITRLPFFLYYPVVGISVDSVSYLSLVAALKSPGWTQFIMRMPGYPLFLWPFTFLPDPWLAAVVFQNILSLASALCLVYAVYRLRRLLALPAAVAMAAVVGGSQNLVYDTGIVSESLYSNTIILAVAFLFLAFAGSRKVCFTLASVFMALTILVRPAGIYFAVIYVIVLAFLLWNRYSTGDILRFLTPFPAILLVVCSYNFATLGHFVVSPFVEANLAGATALYWEPDPSFPEYINKALGDLPASYEKAGVTRVDFATLRTSWDPYSLAPLFQKQYNSLVWVSGWGSGSAFGSRGYLFYRPYIREVSLMAIRKHPVFYAKYVWTNFVCFFFRNIHSRYEFYSALKERVTDEFITGKPEYQNIPGELGPVIPPLPPAIQIVAAGGAHEVVLAQHYLTRPHIAWQAKHWKYFLNGLWVWGYFAIFAMSGLLLFQSHGRHLGAFLLFALSLVALGAGIVVALLEPAIDRYSCPTQFVFYLSVALVPLLWSNINTRPDHIFRLSPPPRLGNADAADKGSAREASSNGGAA
jgi:hypothetical protein